MSPRVYTSTDEWTSDEFSTGLHGWTSDESVRARHKWTRPGIRRGWTRRVDQLPKGLHGQCESADCERTSNSGSIPQGQYEATRALTSGPVTGSVRVYTGGPVMSQYECGTRGPVPGTRWEPRTVARADTSGRATGTALQPVQRPDKQRDREVSQRRDMCEEVSM